MSIDLALSLRNNEKNRWDGGFFEFNESRGNTSTERHKEKFENVSSTEKDDVVRPTANFPIFDVKDYNITGKTMHYIQGDHIIKKPKTKNVEVDENPMKERKPDPQNFS